MATLENYNDILHFIDNTTHKQNFKYNGVNYGVMVANDSKTVIRDFKNGVTIGKKQFLNSINPNSDYEYIPPVEAIEVQENVQELISPDDYKSCFIEPKIIQDNFLKNMQLPFKDEYLTHPAIAFLDLDRLKALYPHLKAYGKKNILFYAKDNTINISIKYKKDSGWFSLKGTQASLGAFFKSNNQTSTLLLVEGLKDGVNTNITFKNVDVLVANGKGNQYNFKAHGINLDDYKYIIFVNDRDNEENLLTMFREEHKAHYHKTKYLDWSKIEKGKDITDIIENIILPKHKTKRDRSRGALATLKRLLFKNSFENEYKRLEIKKATIKMNEAIKKDNKLNVMKSIKNLNYLKSSLLEGAKYYLKKQNETKLSNTTIINLGFNKLSNCINEMLKVMDSNNKIFLNAPTGTGKSYTSLNELPKHFKNIIIVSPLRMVTNEHGANEAFTNVKFDVNYNEVEADLNSNCIAITTDAFTKLKDKYKVGFSERLARAELIIFDEQHLYYDSLGFRDKTVVACYEYLLKKYNGKVMFMSGTPIIPNDVEVALVTAKVDENAKKHINFYNNMFEDEKAIIQSLKKDLKKGAVLFYTDSKEKVKEVEELLLQTKIKTLSITSERYKLDGVLVDDTITNKELGYIVYVSTTKATTGVNFKDLRVIYQYGTTYTPNTFIQLMARLRENGTYYKIDPKNNYARERNNVQNAKGLIFAFTQLNVRKISDSYISEDFQKWLKKYVSTSTKNKNTKDFLNVYLKPLQLIESKGYGKFNKENDDFSFFGVGTSNIKEVFKDDESNEFRRYIEQVLIDWILNNHIEMLNDYYNLSFKINCKIANKGVGKTYSLKTEERKAIQKEERVKKEDEKKALYEELDAKLESIEIDSKLLLKHKFTDTEIAKLNDIKIDIEEVGRISDYQDKLTALKYQIIPKQEIFKIANKLIIENDFLVVKDLGSELQTKFLTNKRNKNPYEKLLIETFKSELFNNSYLDFTKKKMINKKYYYNILTISKEHKQYFEDLKNKKAKDKFLEEQSINAIEKIKKENNYPQEPTIKEQIEVKEKILLDEGISLKIRMKTMHELAILTGEVSAQ